MSKQSKEPTKTDTQVVHPAHYNLHPGGIECIKIIQHHNLNTGTAMKYLWRQGLKISDNKKESTIRDLKKAIEYIQFEIDRVKEFE